MLVSLLRLLNVSFSDQAQIPMARIPKPRSWIQMRHEKLSRSIYKVTHPKDDVESEDDIFEATGHLTGVPDPPPPLLVLRVVARRHLRTPRSPGTLAIYNAFCLPLQNKLWKVQNDHDPCTVLGLPI